MWLILDGAALDFQSVGQFTVSPPKPQKTCDSPNGLLLTSLNVNGWGGISEQTAL